MDNKTSTLKRAQKSLSSERTFNMMANCFTPLLADHFREDLEAIRPILQEVRFFHVWLSQCPEEAGEAVKRLVEHLTEGEIPYATVVNPVVVNVINSTQITTEITNHEQL